MLNQNLVSCRNSTRRACLTPLPFPATTYSIVRLELAVEEAADVASGILFLHKVSPSAFLRQALDVEEKQ